MAGLGRRTHYRKHLTDSVLHDLPEPAEDERIAKVVSTRGGNQFDILLASNDSASTDRTPQLAILPTKFHKLVWVKRNDYVIVQTTIDDDDDENDAGSEGADKDPQDTGATKNSSSNNKQDGINDGIRYIITHILYKDQVKHLKSKGLWPANDPEFGGDGDDDNENDVGNVQENEDGIVYIDNYYDDDDEENMDEIFVNTNRLARVEIQDSDDSSSEEED